MLRSSLTLAKNRYETASPERGIYVKFTVTDRLSLLPEEQ
jgi:hypothetical protein